MTTKKSLERDTHFLGRRKTGVTKCRQNTYRTLQNGVTDSHTTPFPKTRNETKS